MKNRRLTLKSSLILLSLMGSFARISAQNDEMKTVYNWFDKELGKENLDINNGTLHINYDKTVKNEHRYYETNSFVNGSVNYNNQDYFDVAVKYDIYEDQLVLNPKNQESSYITINLAAEKIKTFKINKKTFANLTLLNLPSEFRKGFYEENLIGKSFTFYIKHYKFRKETTQDSRPLLNYFYETEFIVFFNNAFHEINSKRNIVSLFPKYKVEIYAFYSKHEKLETENKIKHMEKLMTLIDNLIKSESN